MSLRTRLLIITAVSLMALLIAFFSAWRTAQMSRTFALQQAEANVSQAAREIIRRSEPELEKPRPRPVLPHEKEIIERYGDSPTSRVAIALQGNVEVSGGFCDRDGKPANFISSDSNSGNFSADEMQIAQAACRKIISSPDLTTETISLSNDSFIVASASNPAPDLSDFTGVFAFRRLPKASVFGDWLNLTTQVFLLVAAIGLVSFSFTTWRNWQHGMRQVEDGMAAIAEDLTARIVPPQTLELEKVSRSINDLTAHLESNLRREAALERSIVKNEKLAALGRVVAGVAHEVRNPLASMKLKIQLAERNKFDSTRIEQTFKVLHEEIERLDSLVKKLLDLSRSVKLTLTEFSLVKLIEERVAMMSDKFDSNHVQVEFVIASPHPRVTGDRERLIQVFDNLLLNAAEAMQNGGSLLIDIATDAEIARTRIIDNGSGVSAEIREKLFEPFFTTKERGSGLGLAISREIIEAHNGRLYFAEYEAGTAFMVELPLVVDVGPEKK